jgi:hypothetical protein
VTTSADCPESFSGVCDIAIGSFGSGTSILEGTCRIITSEWAKQHIVHDQ